MDELEAFFKTRIVEKVPDYLAAVLILVIGIVLIRLAKRWLNAVLGRSRIKDDLLLRSFFVRVLSAAIVVSAVLAALKTIGFEVESFVAGLGITGIILGFGFRDTLSNLAAGLMLLIYRPFRAGEVIEVEGTQGTVQELTIVNMQMTTTDGVRVIMPNSKVWGAKIVNYSLSRQRRLELIIRIGDDAADQALRIISEVLEADHRLLQTPPPVVRATSISNHAVTLTVWVWVLPEKFEAVEADMYLRFQKALSKGEISIL